MDGARERSRLDRLTADLHSFTGSSDMPLEALELMLHTRRNDIRKLAQSCTHSSVEKLYRTGPFRPRMVGTLLGRVPIISTW